MEIANSTALVNDANRGLARVLAEALLERGVTRVYAGSRDHHARHRRQPPDQQRRRRRFRTAAERRPDRGRAGDGDQLRRHLRDDPRLGAADRGKRGRRDRRRPLDGRPDRNPGVRRLLGLEGRRPLPDAICAGRPWSPENRCTWRIPGGDRDGNAGPPRSPTPSRASSRPVSSTASRPKPRTSFPAASPPQSQSSTPPIPKPCERQPHRRSLAASL